MTKDEFTKLVQDQKASGLTVRDYCKQIGMSMSTYCYWKRKLKEVDPPCGLVPMQVSADSRATKVQQSLPIASGVMMIHFPNGVKVEFMQSDDSVGIGMLNHMCQRYVLPE